MPSVNLIFAWCWIVTGLLVGALLGMGFHKETFMGGYASWRRRMMRLGHIAFLGTAMLNMGLTLSVRSLGVPDSSVFWPGLLLIVGAVAMPSVCFLSAWIERFRGLFFIPVLSLVVGCGWFAAVVYCHQFK